MYSVILLFSIFLSGVASTRMSNVGKELSSRVKRNVPYGMVSPFWPPGSPIAYLMDKNISDDPLKMDAITSAIKYISDRTCVDFVENATASEGIKFIRNSSYNGVDANRLGYMKDFVIEIKLDDNLGNQMDVIIQQLMFALGFIGHLKRSDRDEFANVDKNDLGNIPFDYFALSTRYYYKQTEDANYLSVPYEYGSVVHLGPTNVQDNGYKVNVTTKNPDYQNTIGTYKVSFFDMEMINQQYCSNITIKSNGTEPPVIKKKIDLCKHALSAPCGNGGYPNPRNCQVCVCPAGFGGAWCYKRQEGFGAYLNATSEWKTQDVNFVGEGTALRYKFDEGTYLISAPYLAMIQVRITQMGDDHCKPGCTTGAAEIKLGDPRMSGIRICCSNLLNKVFDTPLNPMPVLVYNRQGSTKFTFQYRALGYGIN